MSTNHQKQLDIYNVPLNKKEQTFSYFLDKQTPRLEYNNSYFTNNKSFYRKNGQRKLLMTELYFLTQNPKGIVVYVGAAPFSHGNLLLQLFPQLTFHLYDPRDFLIKESSRVKIFKQFFGDHDCIKYNAKYEDISIVKETDNVIFISDIRTMEGYDESNKAENQSLVQKDQEMQENWVKLINPTAFSLKFKLNWNNFTQMSLDGQLFIQSWNSLYSMETRLMGKGYKKKEYDCKEYEEQMFYYNTQLRFQKFKRNSNYEYPSIYCQCHDCTSECNILNEYVKKGITKMSVNDIRKKVMKVLIIKKDINEM